MRDGSLFRVGISDALLTGFDTVIDVRSPSEFADDHLPGAINCPVLDDDERARIGTLYKQDSAFAAKKLGAALVARNIARHLELRFCAMPKGWRPLVYCWRGGKRSAAMAHVLREIGWNARALDGGYRAYRRHVLARLAEVPGTLRYRVVQGVTGSGKSRLLQALRSRGAQVLDLEDLAAHRGSVLGDLPDRPQPTQKMFDSRLLAALRALDALRPVYVEGESRKIGQVQLPEALIDTMRASECVLLDTGVDTRVELLMDEYRHFFTDRESLQTQLECLATLHGRERITQWKQLAADGEWRGLVTRLLLEHYDPAYRRSASRNFVRLGLAQRVTLESGQADAFVRTALAIIAGESGQPVLAIPA